MLKLLLAASLALVPATDNAPDSLRFVAFPLIHRVDCNEGRGTAFRIGRDHWLSVAHVTAMHGCKVDGRDISLTEQDSGHDFSRFDVGGSRFNGLPVNCTGFVPGQWYWSIGYAKGGPVQVAIALYATYAKDGQGKRVLIGEYNVIPGMSGGPVMDMAGNVVGLVNAYIPGTPISLSRELKDTSICGAGIA